MLFQKFHAGKFDKFESANRTLGTQMKATGEVMSIGRNLEESLLKAVRSLELGIYHLELDHLKELDKETMKNALLKQMMSDCLS